MEKVENLKVWKSLLWSEDKSQKALHVLMVVAAFMMMGVVLLWILAGCSMLEGRMQTLKLEKADEQLHCIPDEAFPHLCDGWLLDDKPLQLKETEE